jgi:protein-tyrosine kinase
MENIRQAIERAKERPEHRSGIDFDLHRQQANRGFDNAHGSDSPTQKIELDAAHLQSRRMIAYDGQDPRSRSFDMLRTQVMRSMDLKGWRILAVTSPTPQSGKTLTAINLALSIARQPERQVLLVDMDLRRPQIACCLGLMADTGVLGVLEGHVALTCAIVQARVGNCKFEVLPTAPTSHASDLMSSRAMSALLQDIRGHGQSHIVILDLPPLLTGDEAIAILPQVDCVLPVAAVGVSTIAEIQGCNKHLQSTDVVRFVLNKVPESRSSYDYY